MWGREESRMNFRFVVASPSPILSGNWTYQIAMGNGPCQPVTLSDIEMKTMLETGMHIHAGVSYTFEPDMLTACNVGRYYLGDAEIKALRNSVPKMLDIKRPGGGANPSGIDFTIGLTQMVVYNTGGPLVSGPMDAIPSSPFELPARIVNESGAAFSPLNGPSSAEFLEFTLLDLLSNPDRITAEFMFVARQPGGDLRILVWDGEIVLQE